MLAFPNIKINLGLSITEKRPDTGRLPPTG